MCCIVIFLIKTDSILKNCKGVEILNEDLNRAGLRAEFDSETGKVRDFSWLSGFMSNKDSIAQAKITFVDQRQSNS
jgi:hypothetical protein